MNIYSNRIQGRSIKKESCPYFESVIDTPLSNEVKIGPDDFNTKIGKDMPHRENTGNQNLQDVVNDDESSFTEFGCS